MKNDGALPGGIQLQDHYLPVLFDEHVESRNATIPGIDLCVILDEMSDDVGRYVLNILASTSTVSSHGCLDAYLLNVVFLEKTNNAIVSQAVRVKTLTVTSYGVAFENVMTHRT